jgi:membrane protein
MPSLEPIRRNRVTGSALATHERFNEVGGGQLASAVTLTVFLSLFPLLLVATAVVGFLSSGDPDLANRVIRDLGLTGDAADMLRDGFEAAERNKASSSVVGFVGFVWAAIGVVGAIQHVCDRAWQVSGRGLKDKAVAAGWLLGSLVVLALALGAAGLVPGLPGWLAPLEVLTGVAFGSASFLWTFRVLTAKPLALRQHLPGALLGGVGLHLLTRVGGAVIGRQVESSSALYGSIGVVFALLAYLLLFGRLLVYAVCLNVVLHERTHGVVHVEVAVPKFDGEVPVEADRSAVVKRRATA